MSGVVRVTFIDVTTGAPVARSTLPSAQPPPSFEAGTTVDISGVSYLVERALPASIADAMLTGELALHVRRIVVADPVDIMFSLPTVVDTAPVSTAPVRRQARFDIHEGDWRQLEVVDARMQSTVELELAAVRTVVADQAVRAEAGRLIGYRSLHVRTEPARPVTIARADLVAVVPAIVDAPSVALRGERGAIADSFAVASGHLVLYGAGRDEVSPLGLHFRRSGASGPDILTALVKIMSAQDLMLVDWCRCAVVGPADVSAYLDQLRPVSAGQGNGSTSI